MQCNVIRSHLKACGQLVKIHFCGHGTYATNKNFRLYHRNGATGSFKGELSASGKRVVVVVALTSLYVNFHFE